MAFKKISLQKLSNHIKYGMYFSMDYLIRFGYFDFKYFSNQVKEDYLLSNIVYKKIFNTNDLTENLGKIQKNISFSTNKETTSIEFSIHKNEDERRVFKLPNIYSYICLCIHLNHHKDKYIEILGSSNKSLSKGFDDTPFLTGKIKREENRFGKKHIFKTDIQNFYPSIYTHSIPWILVGKTVAKSNRGNTQEYYNQLDKLIQNCQRGETHGLPTGSFSSRLIAEIYMCKLDNKLDKYPYVRYVDDFEFPFNDESEKSDFYKELNKALNSLNLKIKVEKNHVESFPFKSNNNSAFFFDYFLNSGNIVKYQTIRIYNFIDCSINREWEGYKGSLKLMFKALKSSIVQKQINEKAFTEPMLKKLFNLVLMTPHLSVYFLEFIDVFRDYTVKNLLTSGIKDIEPQVQMNIDRYIDLNYNQELYSLLSIFYHLKIYDICDKESLLHTIKSMDDLSSILAFELLVRNKNNIDDSLFEIMEEKLENSIAWEDEFWLFKYQVLLRINEDKRSKLSIEYKNFIYKKYGEGLEKSIFFDKKNLKKIKCPINLVWQNKNSNDDISKFFMILLEKKVSFINKN
jgi:hypothetical protein